MKYPGRRVSWLLVEIEEQEEETFRQATRGRPSEQTQYLQGDAVAFHTDVEAESWRRSRKRSGRMASSRC